MEAKEKFDFSEALYSIKCGQKVGIKYHKRFYTYYMDNGEIVCRIDNLSPVKVKKFYMRFIMSNNWELVE